MNGTACTKTYLMMGLIRKMRFLPGQVYLVYPLQFVKNRQFWQKNRPGFSQNLFNLPISGVLFTVIAPGAMVQIHLKQWPKPQLARDSNILLSAITVNQHFTRMVSRKIGSSGSMPRLTHLTLN